MYRCLYLLQSRFLLQEEVAICMNIDPIDLVRFASFQFRAYNSEMNAWMKSSKRGYSCRRAPPLLQLAARVAEQLVYSAVRTLIVHG